MTADAFALALPIVAPLGAALLAFLLPRLAFAAALASCLASLGATLQLALALDGTAALLQVVGGWDAPLGIRLVADGLAVAMLGLLAVLSLAITLHARAYFDRDTALHYWPLWLLLCAALAAAFLAADLFNLYVCLELITLAGVALTALEGKRRALRAALRYLLVSVLGSLLYLLGVALVYHAAGTVDLLLLDARNGAGAPLRLALGLMSLGLALKAALFPLHFWLPDAHGSAPAPVSAALSALVVKAALLVQLRLWLQVAPAAVLGLEQGFALLGAAAVAWGSLQALRQPRMKLLIAYSTVAQIGYFFLVVPLAGSGAAPWDAVVLLLLAHGLAKSALFLAAGNIMRRVGHDRIAELRGVLPRMPLTAGTIALAGVSLMGLPPSGGFVAKWLLLETALRAGDVLVVLVLLGGGLAAAAYLFRLLEQAFADGAAVPALAPPSRHMEFVPLALALAAALLGLVAGPLLALLLPGAIGGGA